MAIQISINLKEYEGKLDFLAKRVFPKSASKTINDISFNTMRLLKEDIDKYVDGGAVPYTKSGIAVDKSNVRTLSGLVGYLGSRFWLKTITYGGVVKPYAKSKVLIEPVKSMQKLNKYGNIPRNTLARKKANTALYFVGKPNNRKGQNKRYGLYRYYKNKAPRLVIALDRKERTQKAIFPAPKIAQKYIKQNFMRRFQIRMRFEIRRMKIPTGF